MTRLWVMLLSLGALLVSCTQSGSKNVSLKNDEDKFSYIIGQNIGNGLKNQGLTVDPDILAYAIKDVMKGQPSKVTPQEMQQIMGKMQAKMMEKQMGAAKENKSKADKFLAENKSKSGIQTTKSGLEYQILQEGKGPSPKVTDVVKVQYRGTLLDGSEFDSSYKRGTPAEFPVGGVIKGWTEALQLMKVGSKWKLWIPPDIAYGESGRPGIPPNSLLTFEVELVSISPPSQHAGMGAPNSKLPPIPAHGLMKKKPGN